MTKSLKQKNMNILKTVILAAASIGLYAILFSNEATVTAYYTKGSFYAALPVATALVFSFVHGAFASGFLDIIGLTARKSPTTRPSVTKEKRPDVKQDRRPRLEVD